jgi:hypothetical protein
MAPGQHSWGILRRCMDARVKSTIEAIEVRGARRGTCGTVIAAYRVRGIRLLYHRDRRSFSQPCAL